MNKIFNRHCIKKYKWPKHCMKKWSISVMRKLQIKSKMWYYYRFTRIVKKKLLNTLTIVKCCQGYDKTRILIDFLWSAIGIPSLQNGLVPSYEPAHLPNINKNIFWHYFEMFVATLLVADRTGNDHNVYISENGGEENLVHWYNRTLCSN